MKNILLISFVFLSQLTFSQSIFWEDLSPMPERITNNAVTTATVDGIPYVYSFAGIDSTKACGNPNLLSFRYNTATDEWETIESLPDPLGGKIAAGASTVKNKVYIIGGYHVASNCSEVSSEKTHIFDPETNTYLPDGAPIPVSIDDQVQDVWRDSLIYVITGWHNTTNVTNVQIYNPTTDEWSEGTPIPNNGQWRVFGGSGSIVGDTIYFAGGASHICNFNNCFSATTTLRRGIINPENPTEITWEGWNNSASQGYRMAASTWMGNPIWIGGSNITYNFDGIDYNGSGGVAPVDRISLLSPSSNFLDQTNEVIPKIMDLRGVAKISESEYILAGGMEENQFVTNRVIKITIDDLSNTDEARFEKINVFPNPTFDEITIQKEGEFETAIFNLQGQLVLEKQLISNQKINLSTLPKGIYFLHVFENGNTVGIEKIIKF